MKNDEIPLRAKKLCEDIENSELGLRLQSLSKAIQEHPDIQRPEHFFAGGEEL